MLAVTVGDTWVRIRAMLLKCRNGAYAGRPDSKGAARLICVFLVEAQWVTTVPSLSRTAVAPGLSRRPTLFDVLYLSQGGRHCPVGGIHFVEEVRFGVFLVNHVTPCGCTFSLLAIRADSGVLQCSTTSLEQSTRGDWEQITGRFACVITKLLQGARQE